MQPKIALAIFALSGTAIGVAIADEPLRPIPSAPPQPTRKPSEKPPPAPPPPETAPPENIPGDLFTQKPLEVARYVAPAWHMDQDMCMPTSARRIDGSKTPGVHPVWGIESDLNNGCEAPDMNKAVDAKPNPFPTYWVLRHCDGDNSWRIVFDVYFVKDGGHIDDWEWAAVKFTQSDKEKNIWTRAGIWMERDGNKPFVPWKDLKNTFSDKDDVHDRNKMNKPRPELWFGKWRHPVFDEPCEISCDSETFPALGSNRDYRSSDFMYDSFDWLMPGSDVPASWKWGEHATSFPASFNAGGGNDLCKLK